MGEGFFIIFPQLQKGNFFLKQIINICSNAFKKGTFLTNWVLESMKHSKTKLVFTYSHRFWVNILFRIHPCINTWFSIHCYNLHRSATVIILTENFQLFSPIQHFSGALTGSYLIWDLDPWRPAEWMSKMEFKLNPYGQLKTQFSYFYWKYFVVKINLHFCFYSS